MKNLKFTLLTLFMLVYSIVVLAQEKVSRIKILETDDARKLKAAEVLQLDHYTFSQDGKLISTVTASDLKRLKAAGFKYEVLVDDAVKELVETDRQILEAEKSGANARAAFEQSGRRVDQIISTPSAFVLPATFGGYWSYAQMVTLIGNLKNTYPTIVDTFGIGFTHLNRRILVVKISDNV